MFRAIAAALSLALLLPALGCAKKDTTSLPKPCLNPVPTLDKCLDAAWMETAQAGIKEGRCADQLVTTCYDLFDDAQGAERLKQAACDDYWKPCVETPCPAATDVPVVCFQVTQELYPTSIRTDGLLMGNKINYACRKSFRPGKPQLHTSAADPLEENLREQILKKRELAWGALPVGGFVQWGPEEQAKQSVMSLTIPAEPRSEPAPGKRSFNFVPIDPLCAGDTLPMPNIVYKSNPWFDDPMKDQALGIAELGSCADYAINKYYDWAVFKARMGHEQYYADDVPDIMRVRKAFGGGLAAAQRGAVGSLFLDGGVISESLEPGAYAAGPNPAFPLTAGVSREVTLVREVLFKVRAANLPAAPDDHRHRLKFVKPDLVSWTSPCPTPASCFHPATTEDWAWHRAMLAKYEAAPVTPTDENLARLQRLAFLELLARRAQVEVAAWMAGRDVTPVARTALLPLPANGTIATWWLLELTQGHLDTTLESVTADERRFLKEQYARDWELMKKNVAAMSDATLEAMLRSIDEMIETSVLEQHVRCLSATASSRPVTCDWLPEMFTVRFEGITERALMDLPPPGAGDLPDAGPSADKHRCDVYTAGLDFSRLGSFAFSCPLNSPVNGVNQHRVCECEPSGQDYLCGDAATFSAGSNVYPLFYAATDYRASIADLQLLFGKGGRVDRMNQVAFAVATSFIPNCSPAPIMTEVRVATQNPGFSFFGAELVEEFSWSKSGALDDRSFLRGHLKATAKVLVMEVPFLDVTATADQVRGSGTRSVTVEVAGMNVPITSSDGSFNDTDQWIGISGYFPFMVGPIPMSVTFGVGGSWTLSAGASVGSPVKANASASMGANLFVEGGVDAGIAGAGIGAYIDIVKLGPTFTGTLGMRTTDQGLGENATKPLQITSNLDLDTVLLSGSFGAWAKVGVCPVCKKFSLTLFSWAGYRLKTPVWSRSLPLTEANLDKLQAWHAPDQCTN